ncbi:hypothetical protein DVJ83_17960 (plasmid) [Deinococcus wulumuqiensis]|uniref:Uncharacterized protein n=1 Tax=Deinococcus wulumuqiensis TaxID=980427 RepID=A0A345IMR1_9DEIO|nr:hypothetical protein [Deinococcus wulumuqiensis]AXH00984.1 hypothetical protein DVJ83_17960 [Deinococcus wulumuqiensis]
MNLSRPDDWRPALARHWTLLSAGEAALVQAFRLAERHVPDALLLDLNKKLASDFPRLAEPYQLVLGSLLARLGLVPGHGRLAGMCGGMMT